VGEKAHESDDLRKFIEADIFSDPKMIGQGILQSQLTIR
jgi:hypothetical protein